MAEMSEERAREILSEIIDENGSLYELSPSYISWRGESRIISLDGDFDDDELEAIVWWMRNNPVSRKKNPASLRDQQSQI